MEEDIENLIEQLTKVRPSMLNEEALKLFNAIMGILDERDNLLKRNRELEEELEEINKQLDLDYVDNNFIPKSKIKEKIEKLKEQYKITLEENCTKAFILKCQITILEELMEDK